MQISKIFQEEDSENSDLLRPWDHADFEGWLSLLTWKVVLSYFLLYPCVLLYIMAISLTLLITLFIPVFCVRVWAIGKLCGSDDTFA